jgi:hypothetical protein
MIAIIYKTIRSYAIKYFTTHTFSVGIDADTKEE